MKLASLIHVKGQSSTGIKTCQRFGFHLISIIALSACLLAPVSAQMKTGEQMKHYDAVFGVKSRQRHYDYNAILLDSNAPGNVFHPGERPQLTFQLQNNLDQPIKLKGKVDVMAYGTQRIPGNIWLPEVHKIAAYEPISLAVDLPPKGWRNFTIDVPIPNRKGGYALVVDLGEYGRRFLTSLVQTFEPTTERVLYPKQSLESMPPAILERLGIQAIRLAVEYTPSDHPKYNQLMAQLGDELRKLHDHKVTVTLEIGAGPGRQPLGRPRPHLTDNNIMMGGKMDHAWLPADDDDYQQFVYDIARQYGWPQGPVTSFMLWNEPWEGGSISGWQADMVRYRELYRRMGDAIVQARSDAGVDVLIGCCDSSSNTWDKLFADGAMDMLPYLDFVSVHYQGLNAPVLHPEWHNRTHHKGRVLVWDTESWIANTDDRVVGVLATNRAAGYDRSLGIFSGNIATNQHHSNETVKVFTQNGTKKKIEKLATAWSLAASVGAVQHFIGEREFKEILYKNGLPWIYAFQGLRGDPEDGTIVVLGDLSVATRDNPDGLLFRTVRSLDEVTAKQKLKRRLAALPPEAVKQRTRIIKQLRRPRPFTGATMTLPLNRGTATTAQKPLFRVYDSYGNPVPVQGDKIVIPLDHRGFFLKANGEAGSFSALLNAVRTARIEGIEPLEMIAHDMTEPIEQQPTLKLTLTNVLNRPIQGKLFAKLRELDIQAPSVLRFAAHETKQVAVKVTGGKAVANNLYPLELQFDAGDDGIAVHEEAMRVNRIAKRTIAVDGQLKDWSGVLPQVVKGDEAAEQTLTEAAWIPFVQFEPGRDEGLATGYLAYDENYFYFAAKIADASPHPGTLRMETRDDDQFFYPRISQELDNNKALIKVDNIRRQAPADSTYLQAPNGTGRVDGRWENDSKVAAFAIDFDIPPDQPRQVALYVPPRGKFHSDGMHLELIDRETGRVLDTQHLRQLFKGVYAVYNLAGKKRIRLQTNDWWYAARIAGLFFDAAPDNSKVGFARLDYETSGNWRGVYGADGYHVIGTGANYPADVRVTVPKVVVKKEHIWPQAVRRFSYRQWPVLPVPYSQARFDNVQIAFNAIPLGQDGWLSHLPGRMPKFIWHKSTDYEYALNTVAEEYGGGFEVWRLQVPGMPFKHFYPRQDKHPLEGPVQNAKLVTVHKRNLRMTEVAIPWSEIPHVKRRLDAGKMVKFSFRVNHDTGGPILELARDRSVSKQGPAFHTAWDEHWANEVEFGFEP